MKHYQKFCLLLGLSSLSFLYIQCDKQDYVTFEEQNHVELDAEDKSLWDNTPQLEAVPVFEVVIREAICLQGGKRLEAVLRNTNEPADLFSYHFQWKVDGILQKEGAVLPCARGQLAEVIVTRHPDLLVVVRQIELGDGTEEAELLYDVR
jgi:hypothetical protein